MEITILFSVLFTITIVGILVWLIYSIIFTKKENLGLNLGKIEKGQKQKIEDERRNIISKYGKYRYIIDDRTYLYNNFFIHKGRKFDFYDIKKFSYGNYCNSETGGEDYYLQIHMQKNDIPVVYIHANSLDAVIALKKKFEKMTASQKSIYI